MQHNTGYSRIAQTSKMRRPTFSILWLSVLLLWAFLAGARAEEAGAAAAAAEEVRECDFAKGRLCTREFVCLWK